MRIVENMLSCVSSSKCKVILIFIALFRGREEENRMKTERKRRERKGQKTEH